MPKEIPYQLYRAPEVRQALEDIFDAGDWWMYKGPRIDDLEVGFAEFHQAKYGVSLSNGTVAMEIALKALQIGQGDEVILPAYDFYSLPKSVANAGATPVFCDVVPGNFTLSVTKAASKITSKTKAVVAVHISSSVAELDALRDLCDKHELFLIEDCAQAHGAVYDGRKVGSFGHVGLFSFGGIKLMTSGQGGMLITSERELYERAYAIANRGLLPDRSVNPYSIIGDNHQLSELQAALLHPQLKRLDQHCGQREEAMQYLDQHLCKIQGILPVVQFDKTTIRAQMAYTFRLHESLLDEGHQQGMTDYLREQGFPAMQAYATVGHDDRLQQLFREEQGSFAASELASKSTVGLRHAFLLEDQQVLDRLVETVRQYLEKEQLL